MNAVLYLAVLVILISLIRGSEAQNFPGPPDLKPVLLVGDHCQIHEAMRGQYFPEEWIGILLVEVGSDSITYMTDGVDGLPETGQMYCIWNDETRTLFAKDRFEGDLELAACVEAQLTDNNDLQLVMYNRWDRGPFQLLSSHSTASNTCGEYPAGGTTVLLRNALISEGVLMESDTCTMPESMRGRFHVIGGEGLVSAVVGQDYVEVGLRNDQGQTEDVHLYCIWNDDTRMILAKDRYEGDLELAACVVATVGYSDDLQLEFLNRRDRGLFQLEGPPTTSTKTCLSSPTEGTVVHLTRA